MVSYYRRKSFDTQYHILHDDKINILEKLDFINDFGVTFDNNLSFWLAVWLSGNTLASINVVALRQTRLVLGWVTVCGRVNHLGM